MLASPLITYSNYPGLFIRESMNFVLPYLVFKERNCLFHVLSPLVLHQRSCSSYHTSIVHAQVVSVSSSQLLELIGLSYAHTVTTGLNNILTLLQ